MVGLGAVWRNRYWYGVIFIGSRPDFYWIVALVAVCRLIFIGSRPDFYWIGAWVAVWRGVMVWGRGPHPACIQGFAVGGFVGF